MMLALEIVVALFVIGIVFGAVGFLAERAID